jgi:hypothetical protein
VQCSQRQPQNSFVAEDSTEVTTKREKHVFKTIHSFIKRGSSFLILTIDCASSKNHMPQGRLEKVRCLPLKPCARPLLWSNISDTSTCKFQEADPTVIDISCMNMFHDRAYEHNRANEKNC